MANEIKVSTTRLGNDANQVNNLIHSMEKEFNGMKANVDQLNNMWEGLSKKAFMKAFNDDIRAFEGVIKELKALQNFETQAKSKYEQCEKQIAGLIESIRV